MFNNEIERIEEELRHIDNIRFSLINQLKISEKDNVNDCQENVLHNLKCAFICLENVYNNLDELNDLLSEKEQDYETDERD